MKTDGLRLEPTFFYRFFRASFRPKKPAGRLPILKLHLLCSVLVHFCSVTPVAHRFTLPLAVGNLSFASCCQPGPDQKKALSGKDVVWNLSLASILALHPVPPPTACPKTMLHTHTFHRSHSFLLLISSQCQFILAVHRIITSDHRSTVGMHYWHPSR